VHLTVWTVSSDVTTSIEVLLFELDMERSPLPVVSIRPVSVKSWYRTPQTSMLSTLKLKQLVLDEASVVESENIFIHEPMNSVFVS
jgi:hypothetical protein